VDDAAREAAFRALAASLVGVDVEAYRAAGRDPGAPVLGLGPPDAPLAFLGRDPGRDEVVHNTGFIGASGRKVRGELCRRLLGREPRGVADLLEAGAGQFWINTVPYKPVGNKPWPEPVRQAFRPWIADLLVHAWRGHHVVALGKEALRWFAVDDATAARIAEHEARADAFEAALEVEVFAPDGASRWLTVHPMPHPSPLNVAWSARFPGLFSALLDRLGVGDAR
jgi:uracil-DNA glycosylase